jgi:hypothetical protein
VHSILSFFSVCAVRPFWRVSIPKPFTHIGERRRCGTIFQNNGSGFFSEQEIWPGFESHDSANPFDLDKDVDPDIVSIPFPIDGSGRVLWEGLFSDAIF